MRIAFFGASVTQQGGESSYVYHVSQALQKCGHVVGQFGYGSMHLADAGMCFIDTVLDFKPELCLLEWFTSGCYEVKDGLMDYWNTLRYKFGQANCALLLLVLPCLNTSEERERMITVSREYMQQYGIKSIDLHKTFVNVPDLLRDHVHTNQTGAKTYADHIVQGINQSTSNMECLKLKHIERSKYCDLKTLSFDQKINRRMRFTLQGEIIGVFMNIGPFSGIICVNVEGDQQTYNLWDEWCYYDRQTIKLSLKSEHKRVYSIEVMHTEFDHSKAKTQLKWDTIPTYFHPLKIFHIGQLEIQDFE